MMVKQIVTLSLFLVCCSAFTSVNAQEQTVGLFVYDSTVSFEGYTLFAPMQHTTTYLIDNRGRLIHSWESDYRPGLSVCLLENGNLLRTGNLGGNPTFLQGGAGGITQEFDWEGTLIWEFTYSNNQYQAHHDIKKLPNGNVLMIAWEYKSESEALEAGRDPSLLLDHALWPDHIIEVEPVGSDSGIIVWEWHVWDHLIQNFDSTKANYGVVAAHPELIDLNYFARNSAGQGGADWNHTNSVRYNEEFNQIILSVLRFSEIWVIDHSTTTEEAAGHTGGNSGKGGDLLYRWGNPEAYQAGTARERTLYTQHDAQWIDFGLPGEGNILIFNNGQFRQNGSYSSVDEIIPPVDSVGNYFLTPGSAYGPQGPVWTYYAENPSDFYAPHISGAQRLVNGNTLICNGDNGIFFEISPDTEMVWRYVNPVIDNGPMVQGDTIPQITYNQRANLVFKIQRYAPDYPGFIGHSLVPGDPIELYPVDVGPILISYQAGTVTLNWTSILNPLVVYYIYASDEPWSGFSLLDQTTTNSWSLMPGVNKKFYRITFEIAP